MSSIRTIQIAAADHPVKSVIVLKSSKAEVVRTFDVTLKGGQNKLVISKLPSTIDTQSVRISGLNPSATKNRNYLSDVACSILEASDDAPDGSIHELEVKKRVLEQEKRVLDTQAEVLVKYANSLDGKQASPDVMTNFLNAFAEHGKTNIRNIAKLEAEIAEIDKQIKEEKKKATLLKGSANTELTAVIAAENDTHVNLKLTYIVNKTNWSPTYELHAVTGDNGQPSRTVSLHYRACVTQSTGEDWTDASLTLSTVSTDTIVKTIPKLNPLWIRVSLAGSRGGLGIFGQPQSQVQQRQQPQGQFGVFGSNVGTTGPAPAFGNTSLFGNTTAFGSNTGFGNNTDFRPPPPPPPPQAPSASAPLPAFGSTFGFAASSTQAPAFGSTFGSSSQTDHGVIPLPEEDEDEEGGEDNDSESGGDDGETPAKLVTQTPMALTYAVRGRSSIPSDGKEHVVTITVLSFETDIEYVSVPRVDPRVYLQCQVKNSSEYRLLPGPVSIILDDSYVSKTTISDVNRNDVFNFTLGDDPSVLVSYSRLSKTVKEGSGSFADAANITTYTASITVQNKHAFPIEKLTLRDALPVTEDRRVRVVLRKPKELIEAKEGVLVKVKKGHEEETAEQAVDEGLRVRWTREKEGLYEYRWRVNADDRVKLETVFEMKASTDLTCTFSEPTSGFGVFGKKG